MAKTILPISSSLILLLFFLSPSISLSLSLRVTTTTTHPHPFPPHCYNFSSSLLLHHCFITLTNPKLTQTHNKIHPQTGVFRINTHKFLSFAFVFALRSKTTPQEQFESLYLAFILTLFTSQIC